MYLKIMCWTIQVGIKHLMDLAPSTSNQKLGEPLAKECSEQ